MAFILKQYQHASLDRLRDFLQRAADPLIGCHRAFSELTTRPYLDQALPPDLRVMPYVCLRVPTGGGKTLLAAYAVGIATREFLRIERSLVLWLAPTTAIVDQTITALRHRAHPYHQALAETFGADLEVVTLEEAFRLSRAKIAGATVIIVSTLAALRAEDTNNRRIYDVNGDLMPHFSGLPANLTANLDRTETAVIYSLANVIRLHRPLVIMDEAHNARTALSMETLTRFAPSCIIEFTATPDQVRNPSNILHHVSASELKAEHMVKLPINLTTCPQWREALSGAIDRRQRLENLAIEEEAQTGEYLRPILLLQAQPNSATRETINVETLRRALVEEFTIPAEQIAEATGNSADLPTDLLERSSPVRFIITVSKLREGWDCPFAYVLCTVAHSVSSTAVEQILGRVLRLPKATKKNREELNTAYAFATSPHFHDAAQTLTDALVVSGFDRFEAAVYIVPQPVLPGTEDPGTLLTIPTGPVQVEIDDATGAALASVIAALPPEMQSRFTLGTEVLRPTTTAAAPPIVYNGQPIDEREAAVLRGNATTPEARQAVERLVRKTRSQPSHPAALGVEIKIPVLAIRQGTLLERFEDQFREAPWNLGDCDATLSETEFSATPNAETGLIDLDETGRIRLQQFEQLRQQLTFNDICGPKTLPALVVWLDQAIDHPDIAQAQSGVYLHRLVESLIQNRHIPLETLITNRYRLRDAARVKIDQHRQTAVSRAYQLTLSATSPTPLEVAPACIFSFPPAEYPANRFYEGRCSFRKHYYQRPADMNDEEARCALLIDSSPQIETWVRNLERQPAHAFWLQTMTDKFYPDFVAKLTDGRFLVIEYKGANLLDIADTREKKILGDLWSARSNGRCLFRLLSFADLSHNLSV